MSTHDDLLHLCRTLGEPARDLAVLGEGNASARLDDHTLLVTASGSTLASQAPDELVEVRLPAALDLARPPAGTTRHGVGPEELMAIAVPRADGTRLRPSIETLLHALLLDRTDASFVGHTHPTSVLGLACSDRVDEAFAGPIFPDEVVVCGPAYLVVPYASPGLPLAAALDTALAQHRSTHGVWPKAVILTNHGLLALGATSAEVVAVTTMVDKSARIRTAALAVGALRSLDPNEVHALAHRDDERYRRRLLVEGSA